MSSLRVMAADLPEGAVIEVWGDNTVWLVFNDGRTRVRMLEWAEDKRERHVVAG